VKWQPFELHPEIPKKGIKVNDLLFPKGYLETVMANVRRLAEEDGLTFKRSDKLPNSQLALMISEFARNKRKFDEFHRLVFINYWKEGKDIGNIDLLLEIAESIGLDENEILDYIKSDEPLNRIRKSTDELGRCGINSVPTFLIEDKFIIGAQAYSVFEKVINKILETEKSN
jgi:predicted DsbA family dithiol-disulfide isomerase